MVHRRFHRGWESALGNGRHGHRRVAGERFIEDLIHVCNRYDLQRPSDRRRDLFEMLLVILGDQYPSDTGPIDILAICGG